MQKILLSLSFVLSSFAVASPDCMVGYGMGQADHTTFRFIFTNHDGKNVRVDARLPA